MKKHKFLFIFLFIFLSCEKQKVGNVNKTQIEISGAYHVGSEPEGESGNIYVFSAKELDHFVKNKNGFYSLEARFDYYIKDEFIYTCLPYVSLCKKEKYYQEYEIISIDTIGDEQVVKLKSNPYNLTLKKAIY